MAAGKKMAKTEKNDSPSRKYGRKFSFAMDSVSDRDEMCLTRFMVLASGRGGNALQVTRVT